MPLTSPAEALALLRRAGMVTASAHLAGVPCLAEEVAGGRISGSWWGHPAGKAIYALLEGLEEGDEAVSLKLLEGKATYLHRDLWPALLAVVLDEGWRRERGRGLGAAARELLQRVELAPRRGEAPAAVRALEVAVLVHCGSEHTERGRHEKRLTSWAQWARAHQVQPEGSAEEGLRRLEAAAAGHALAVRPAPARPR